MRQWTIKEISYLKENRSKPIDEQAKLIKRTRGAIIAMRHKIKISNPPGGNMRNKSKVK